MIANFETPFKTILAVYLVILFGMFCRKCGALSRETIDSVLKFVVNVLVPSLIASKVLSNPAFNDPRNVLLPPLTGMGVVLLGILVAWLFGFLITNRLTGLDNRQQINTFAVCVGVLNYGYIPIPLLEDLYPGNDRLLAVLFMQNIGSEFILWTVCVFILSNSYQWSSLKNIINIPTCMILITMGLNLTHLDTLVPELVMKPIHIIGESAIPISLLFVGASVADLITPQKKKSISQFLRISLASCLVRLLILPFLILLLAKHLPCSQELKIVLVVHAAMASAIFPIVLVRLYHGCDKTAVISVLSNSLLAILTTPLWISFGIRYLHL